MFVQQSPWGVVSHKLFKESITQSRNIKNGVKIHSLSNGKLKEAGLKPGFIITHIDKKPVNKTAQLMEIFNKENGGVLIEGIYINGTKGYYGFGL